MWDILFGDPAETEETIRESLDWWKSHPEYGLNLSMIITLPDAPIYKYAIAEGLIKDKLQYMKDGLKVINLTKLGDKKFIELSIIVWASNYDTKHIILAKVISSIKETKLLNGGNSYHIKLKCPECKAVSEYKNMRHESVDKYFLVICRNCRTRLKVETKKCYPENYTIWNFLIYSTFEIARFCLTKYSISRFMYSKFGPKCVKILRSLPRF